MRIAQVSPLLESVPPKGYGGTERVVSYLTEELVRQGHEVTLFASGDSETKARLVSSCPHALRVQNGENPLARHIVQIQDVADHAGEFDIIHFHNDFLHFPFSQNLPVAKVTTLHGRLDLEFLQPVYNRFLNQPLVSISNSQRRPLPQAFWADTIYHGLPPTQYSQGDGAGDDDGSYIAFIGRMSPEKRPDRAIEIALKAGIRLKMAAKIDPVDAHYFNSEISSRIDGRHIRFIGEIGEEGKKEFLEKATALVFPIDWPEPFGMVMIEAMACGTPVIAWANGSVPEVVDHGESGFVVNTVDDAVMALRNIGSIDRSHVRGVFENRFSVETMADRYVRLYAKLASQGASRHFISNGRMKKIKPEIPVQKRKISL